MTHPIVIREAGEGDLEAIVALLADDPLGVRRERVGPPLDAAYRAAFAAMRAQPGNVQLVAESDGGVIGCLQLVVIPGLSHAGMTRALLEGVRVARALRGRGIGAQLVESAVARARAAGCGMVQLTSNASRVDARRFYERLGFRATHVGMQREVR